MKYNKYSKPSRRSTLLKTGQLVRINRSILSMTTNPLQQKVYFKFILLQPIDLVFWCKELNFQESIFHHVLCTHTCHMQKMGNIWTIYACR